MIPFGIYVAKLNQFVLERFSTQLECNQLKKNILTGWAHGLNANSLNLTGNNLISYYIREAVLRL